MAPDLSPSSSDVWEVEQDRFGVMFSGPLEVGECIRVVSEAEIRRVKEAYSDLADESRQVVLAAGAFRSSLPTNLDRAIMRLAAALEDDFK